MYDRLERHFCIRHNAPRHSMPHTPAVGEVLLDAPLPTRHGPLIASPHTTSLSTPPHFPAPYFHHIKIQTAHHNYTPIIHTTSRHHQYHAIMTCTLDTSHGTTFIGLPTNTFIPHPHVQNIKISRVHLSPPSHDTLLQPTTHHPCHAFPQPNLPHTHRLLRTPARHSTTPSRTTFIPLHLNLHTYPPPLSHLNPPLHCFTSPPAHRPPPPYPIYFHYLIKSITSLPPLPTPTPPQLPTTHYPPQLSTPLTPPAALPPPLPYTFGSTPRPAVSIFYIPPPSDHYPAVPHRGVRPTICVRR